MTENGVRDLIIIGGGPAGYTAALYAARANLEPVVIEGFQWGGQLMITSDVENYPGYAEGVLGPEMMKDFRRQAERFGAEFISDDVTRVDFSEQPFRIWVGDEEYRSEAVIIATGADARKLGLESEQRLQARGVSYCAVCDGAFFREKEIVVVGGGDSAMEEAIFLTKFADKVTLVHRREEFRASQIMEDRARANDKIEFVTNAVVEEVLGENSVTGVTIRDVNTGERRAPGRRPLRGDRTRSEHETLRRPARARRRRLHRHDPGSTQTSVEGVFAGGDVVDHTYRQAVTAAGMGCMTALDAERWLAAAKGIWLRRWPHPASSPGQTRLDGQRSFSTHASHRGLRASQTRRPCQIRRCGKMPQNSRGTSFWRSRSIRTGSSCFVRPRRCDSRRTCVSTTTPCGSPSSAATTLAVLRATPGKPQQVLHSLRAPARRTPRSARASSRAAISSSVGRSPSRRCRAGAPPPGRRDSPPGGGTSRTAAR